MYLLQARCDIAQLSACQQYQHNIVELNIVKSNIKMCFSVHIKSRSVELRIVTVLKFDIHQKPTP